MKKDIDRISSYLDELYDDAHCELNYKTPYQLLVAVILSAQCTDKRVNIVTEKLFSIAPTPNDILNLGEDGLKEIIKPCGFYNSKAKSIISSTKEIVEKYAGEIPTNFDDMTKLKGVGRKTANVVLAECFKREAIAVDTHVLRVSKRLNLTSQNATPENCEKDLEKIIKKDKQIKFHHQMIFFGRYFCKAIKPNCAECKLRDICKYYKKKG